MIATVLTALIGSGLTPETSFRPQFADDFPTLKWVDATDRQYPNLPGAPTAILIDVECDAAQLAAIESSPDYFVVSTE